MIGTRDETVRNDMAAGGYKTHTKGSVCVYTVYTYIDRTPTAEKLIFGVRRPCAVLCAYLACTPHRTQSHNTPSCATMD